MIPENSQNLLDQTERTEGLRTYRVLNNTLVGTIDAKDALMQTVAHILQTERYAFRAYDFNYGVELESVVGIDRDLLTEVLTSRITDALSVDDRISEIKDFSFIFERDTLHITFLVVSIFGDLTGGLTIEK